MNTSKFLAKIISVVYLSVGLGYLVSENHYRTIFQNFSEPNLTIYVLGISLIVAGLAIIQFHNIWEYNWKVWITITGWASLIKGIIFMVFPNFLSYFSDMVESPKYYSFSGTFGILIGLAFGYLGFFYKDKKGDKKDPSSDS